MNTLGIRLKQTRERLGLSQKEAAQRLGISNVVLNRYEQGERKPDPEMLRHIADTYDVTVDYLLGLTDVNHRREDRVRPLDLKEVLGGDEPVTVNGRPLDSDDKKRLATLIDTALAFKESGAKPEAKGAEETLFNPETFQKDLDIERLASHIEGEYGRKPSQKFLRFLAEWVKHIRREHGIEE